MPLIAAMALLLFGGGTEDRIGQLRREPAVRLDPALPERPFARWLRDQLPPGAVPVFHMVPCSTGEADCLLVECPIISRARTLWLEFDSAGPRFLGGRMDAPDAERPIPVDRLSELADRLGDPIRLNPLDCPDGTRPRLAESAAGLRLWCEDAAGRMHGPARSWFNAGRYLMSRGRYEAGERVGRWIECDRFERCRVRHYE